MAKQSDPQARATVVNGWIVGICAIAAALIAGFFALRASESQKAVNTISATATAGDLTRNQLIIVTIPPIEVTREVEKTIDVTRIVTVEITTRPVLQTVVVEKPVDVTRVVTIPIEITSVPASVTEVPTALSTSSAALVLPFKDAFDQNRRKEWAIVSGTPLIQDGRLTTPDGMTLKIGDASLQDFTVEFDSSRGDLILQFGPKFRFHRYLTHGGERNGCSFDIYSNDQWVPTINVNCYNSNGVHRIEILGDTYKVSIAGTPITKFTYEGVAQRSPLVITFTAGMWIDDFSITETTGSS